MSDESSSCEGSRVAGSDSESWDSDADEEDKPSESDEESGQEEAERYDGVHNEEEQNDDRISEMPRKRVKTENSALGEIDSASAFDAPINVSQQTIKREPDSGDQISNDVDMANGVTLSSDEESDQVDDELPPQSSTFSANLKLVYDVEYMAPE